MNKLVEVQQNPIATTEKSPLEQYGEAGASMRNIVGKLLKFTKGDWIAGQDGEQLDEGTNLTVNTDTLMAGWIKWIDNHPAEHIMGLVVERFTPPLKDELPDRDPTTWERDNRGEPRDPWQFTNYIIMKEVGRPYDPEKAYTFTTSSKGGTDALKTLAREAGMLIRTQFPDKYPIVELNTRSYDHKDFGRTKTPALTIVGWEDKKLFVKDDNPIKEVERPIARQPVKKHAGRR